MLNSLADFQLWLGVLKVTVANLLLSFDNAIIIALVASGLPVRQRKAAVFLGIALATLILLVLSPIGIYVLSYPYLRLIGGLLLMWIAMKLLLPAEDESNKLPAGRSTLLSALQAIAIANIVRSIDNVIGIAAAAEGNLWLLITGLVLSVPVLCHGSLAAVNLVERFPFLTTLGAAFIGFLAGDMIASDAVVELWASHHLHFPGWHNIVAAMAAAMVVLFGKIGARFVYPMTVPVRQRRR